jgi:hypothetical protein
VPLGPCTPLRRYSMKCLSPYQNDRVMSRGRPEWISITTNDLTLPTSALVMPNRAVNRVRISDLSEQLSFSCSHYSVLHRRERNSYQEIVSTGGWLLSAGCGIARGLLGTYESEGMVIITHSVETIFNFLSVIGETLQPPFTPRSKRGLWEGEYAGVQRGLMR